jgi:hypothetical protein
MNTPIQPMRVIGSQSLTVNATAGGVTLTLPAKQDGPNAGDITLPRLAYVTNEAQEVRWSVNPAITLEAAAGGHAMAAGGFLWLSGTTTIQNFKAIRTGGSDGTLRVTYFA